MILSASAPPSELVTRFAPSPTGLLHLGHAYSALNASRRARAAQGRFLLRLEDIDPARCRPAFAAAIQEDLAWLGVQPDGPVRMQSAHMAAYQGVLAYLREEKLLYPCFCSRRAILREVADAVSAPHAAPDGSLLYPGTCRTLDPAIRAARLAAGDAHAWRLDMQAALARRRGSPVLAYEDADRQGADRRRICRPERFGDVVLARRDVPASYHLCVVHDDWAQGVTLVTRGEDLRPATDLHCLLQALMNWTTPAYSHHALLRDADGRRLAKRDHAQTLRGLRQGGAQAMEVRSALGFD